MSNIPQCRECGRPSPNGDPCEDCAEVDRILAMSDEEVLAEATPEDLGWARGMKEGIALGRKMAAIVSIRGGVASAFDKGWADFHAGAYWRDNPFPECSQDNADWSRGWCHAEARDSGSRSESQDPEEGLGPKDGRAASEGGIAQSKAAP